MILTRSDIDRMKAEWMEIPKMGLYAPLFNLINTLEQAWEERDALKDDMAWVKDYDPFSSRACPLCTYAYGLYQYPCNFHKEIATLKAKVEELEKKYEDAKTIRRAT